MKQRDTSVEFFRCLMMFGIVLLHAVTLCGWKEARYNPWIASPLMACVDAFVIISGYYGIKFSCVKVLKLYALSFFCAFLMVMIGRFVYPEIHYSRSILAEAWSGMRSHWFLNAYAVLMFCAPLINAGLEKAIEKGRREFVKTFWPIVALAFGWSFLAITPIAKLIVPQSSGLEAYSALTLIGVYIVGRVYRMLEIDKMLSLKYSITWGLILSLLSCFGTLMEYSSPIILLLSVCLFTLFKKMRLPLAWGGVCGVIAPSTFSIFLLHGHRYGIHTLLKIEDWIISHGISVTGSYIIAAILVFLICLLLDVLRRVAIQGVLKMIGLVRNGETK